MQPSTYPKINISDINQDKPLIVCDADEVIFDFMNSFERYLNSINLYFNWASYALEGNILNDKKKAIDKNHINEIINNFFKTNTVDMKLVKGAKQSLNKLSKYFNIIILSNIPFKFYEKRKSALNKHNLNFPFYANKGPKGKTIKYIAKIFKKDIWFIDDSPYQIKSVKIEEKRINTILFVGNSKLEALIKKKNISDYFSNAWKDNLKTILNLRNNYE